MLGAYSVPGFGQFSQMLSIKEQEGVPSGAHSSMGIMFLDPQWITETMDIMNPMIMTFFFL